MPRGKVLDGFQIAQIQEFKGAGWRPRKMAELLECSESVVRNVLRLGDNYNTKNHLRGGKKKARRSKSKSEGHLERNSAKDAPVREIKRGRDTKEWRCFFCSSCCDSEQFQTEEGGGAQGITSSLPILLGYFLDTRNNKNEQLLQHIIKLLTRQADRDQERGNICNKCTEDSHRIGTLYQDLEKVQMKLVHQLKLFREKILRDFGTEDGLEGPSKIMVEAREDDVAVAKEEKPQKLREIMENFQRAVYDKGKVAVNVPCVILDRFAFTTKKMKEASKDDRERLSVPVNAEAGIPTEGQELEDDGFMDHFDDDTHPSDLKDGVLTGPNSAPSLPKLKLKRKALDPDTDHPTGRSKMDVEEPQEKRCRRTASAVARCLISKTACSTEEKREKPPVKPKTNRRKKYKTREKTKEEKPATPKSKKKKVRRAMSCDLCSFTTKTTFLFENHLRSHEILLKKKADPHQPAPHTCDRCSESYFNPQFLAFHLQGHDGIKSITCDSCHERIPYPDIKAHVSAHTDKLFSCVNCSFCCATRERYLDHLTHHGKGRLECDLCSKLCLTKTQLLEHLYETHQVGHKYSCEVAPCKREFYLLAQLKNHLAAHKNPLGCPHCDKEFGDNSKLQYHIRSHTNELPFRCQECPEAYRSGASLHRHRILAHGLEKFRCDYCGKEYMSRGMLKIHLTLHEGTGFPCPQCDKSFGSKKLLKRHQNVHTTELSFICEECGKGFVSRAGLKLHSAVHGGEKKYKCQFCEKAFLYPKYLTDHERIHTGERPYRCEICGKTFNQRGSVNLHKRKVHPDGRDSKEEGAAAGAVPGGTVPPAEIPSSLLTKMEEEEMA